MAKKACALSLVWCLMGSGCALDPYAPHVIDSPPLEYSRVLATTSGCKVRWTPSEPANTAVWTGACDASGFASGPGELTHTWTFQGRPAWGRATGNMRNGLFNGPTSGEGSFFINGVEHRNIFHNTMLDGQVVGEGTVESYVGGVFESSASVTHQDGKATVRQTATGPGTSAPAPENRSSDSDDAGTQVALAILSTAIQVKGMQTAAAQQRSAVAAQNQLAQAERQLALNEAASYAKATQTSPTSSAPVKAPPSAPTFASAPSAPATAPHPTATSYPAPAAAPAAQPSPQSQQAPSGPPSFTSSDQERCDNQNDPLSCTYTVVVANQSPKGILCRAYVTLYRTNVVTGDTDTLSAQDVGYVPATSTSAVSSNLAKGGSYNVTCSYQ